MKNNDLIEITIKRVPQGVLLKIKSPIIHNFFKDCSLMVNQDYEWSGNSPFNPKNLISESSEFYNIVTGWKNPIMKDNKPNLSFLRAENLNIGAKFLLRFPITDKQIRAFSKSFPAYTCDFYAEHIAPLEIISIVKKYPDLAHLKKGLQKQESKSGKQTVKEKHFNKMSNSEFKGWMDQPHLRSYIQDVESTPIDITPTGTI